MLHEDDDLICKVGGAHMKDLVRRYLLDVRVCFHLINPIRPHHHGLRIDYGADTEYDTSQAY